MTSSYPDGPLLPQERVPVPASPRHRRTRLDKAFAETGRDAHRHHEKQE